MISNSSHEKVDRSDDLCTMLLDLGDRGSQLTLRNPGELRRQHQERLTFDHQERRQRLQEPPHQRGSRTKRHHDPGFQPAQQVVLDVEKEGSVCPGARILVAVDRELGHQKLRTPSLKTPSLATSSL